MKHWKCRVIGHNWVGKMNQDGTGQWQECARCGQERITMSGFGAKGWF